MNRILIRILTFATLLVIATSLVGCLPPPWWRHGGHHRHFRGGGFTTSIKRGEWLVVGHEPTRENDRQNLAYGLISSYVS